MQVENGSAHIHMPPFSAMIIVSDDIVNTEPEAVSVHEENNDSETEIVIGAHYRHYKGGEYEIIVTARHSENNEDLVVYRNINDGTVWARPKAIFCGKAGDGTIRRFVKLQ